MKQAIRLLIAFALGGMILSGLLGRAQQTNVGNITGSVEDTTGAIMPEATVVAVNSGTGVTQSTITTSGGVYFMNLLPVGRYHVTVTKPGFQKETKLGVAVIAGQTSTVNFALQVEPRSMLFNHVRSQLYHGCGAILDGRLTRRD
jgi:hypothetical protein